MKIAIAGGTGLVGTMVVELAEAAGHQVVVLARGRGTDLETGHGVTATLVPPCAPSEGSVCIGLEGMTRNAT